MTEDSGQPEKRGNKFINLVISDDPGNAFVDKTGVKDFLAMPGKRRYPALRHQPYQITWYQADKRNVEQLRELVSSLNKRSPVKIGEVIS
ncbi:hypothetical protein FW774_10225 [Pedobacter sp. BS3]|uniref:hypothetical protein n=1 Tax=Pedobacter sp. BS3 TaxID=2567937 RepID=UPI0011EC20CD|nr:hypothetical protein [Pedobacter sp. BS3]TZF83831.1 hypothetical protein FW774_10225 [Pedobacter sp. BS3]